MADPTTPKPQSWRRLDAVLIWLFGSRWAPVVQVWWPGDERPLVIRWRGGLRAHGRDGAAARAMRLSRDELRGGWARVEVEVQPYG